MAVLLEVKPTTPGEVDNQCYYYVVFNMNIL